MLFSYLDVMQGIPKLYLWQLIYLFEAPLRFKVISNNYVTYTQVNSSLTLVNGHIIIISPYGTRFSI